MMFKSEKSKIDYQKLQLLQYLFCVPEVGAEAGNGSSWEAVLEQALKE